MSFQVFVPAMNVVFTLFEIGNLTPFTEPDLTSKLIFS
ncbi:hypothetical protein BTJ45_05539 [Bacillus mycoides]|nr:hypothetical protein BTJ45_05539 [Bacillus mycoides]